MGRGTVGGVEFREPKRRCSVKNRLFSKMDNVPKDIHVCIDR